MTHIVLVAKAYAFAAERHMAQRRKGAGGEPYINHLVEVASLVAEATEGADCNLIAAAVLHDTVEDTGSSHAELKNAFNEDVAELVMEVTDDKSLPKQLRKDLQVRDTPKKSARAKIIKLADKISNLRSLANSPPADWPKQRKLDYLSWARRVIDGTRGVCPQLEKIFDDTARNLEIKLGEQ